MRQPVDHHLVVVLIYNEERFICSVVLKLKCYQVQVIVVDVGLRDDTAKLTQMAGASVMRLDTNQGKAAALNAGFEKVRLLDPEVIVMLDADAQHHPKELPTAITTIVAGQADLVIGSCYLKNISNTPVVRLHRACTRSPDAPLFCNS